MENIQDKKLFHELQKVCDVLVRNVNTNLRSKEKTVPLSVTEILSTMVSKGKIISNIIVDKYHPLLEVSPLLGIFTSVER